MRLLFVRCGLGYGFVLFVARSIQPDAQTQPTCIQQQQAAHCLWPFMRTKGPFADFYRELIAQVRWCLSFGLEVVCSYA